MTIDYGTDLSCIDDLDPVMVETSGIEVLAQGLLRRLITPRGRLLDDPDYGINLRDSLSDVIDTKRAAVLQGQIENELLKDERVASVESSATLVQRTLTVKLLVEVAEGPFNLTLSISDVSASVIAVE